MPGPTARPMAQRRADIAQRLRPALETLLGSGPCFRDLSVESICTAAGLARSTFYIHFEDKGHLLQVLGGEVVDELLVLATRWPALDAAAGEPDLALVLTDLLRCYQRRALLIGALTEEAVHDQRVRREFRRLYDIGHHLLVDHLRTGQQIGSVRPEIDAASTVPWLLAMLDRGFYLLLRRPRVDLDAEARSVAGIIWRTLYDGAPTRPTH